ncbi:MAG: hypothetical protein WCE63_04940 [Acidobacteriaceae bacterium]
MNRDNSVQFENLSLQIERVQWRGTLAGCTVTVHQHLDGTLGLCYGHHRVGSYTAQGAPIRCSTPQAEEKALRGKVQNRTFPLCLCLCLGYRLNS